MSNNRPGTRALHPEFVVYLRQFVAEPDGRGGHATISPADARVIVDAADRLAALMRVCAQVYQAAGAYNMPERVLDVLSDAANGDPIRHADILPVEEPDYLRRLVFLGVESMRLRLKLARVREEPPGLIVRAVAELPDRNSPDGWPEAMIVTGEELAGVVRDQLATITQETTHD